VTNKITWDTTLDPINYPKEIKNKYFNLFLKNRKKFSLWVGALADKNSNNLYTLIKLPYSRDPYKSQLFKNILILSILKDVKIRNKIKTLIFASKAMKNSYLNLVKINKIQLKVQSKKKSIYIIVKSFIFSFLIFLFVKTFRIKVKINKNKLLLFNTFLSCENRIKDYVFPGLNKILKQKKIKNYYFIPNILLTRKIFTLYKNLKFISKRNFLFKENYINFNEFMNCFFFSLLNKFKDNNYKKYNNMNCSQLIGEELKTKTHFYSEFQSNLKLIFIKKLKESEYKLKKSFGRFENQSLDKAWFYGMRKYFPETEILGFQNFLYYPHLLNQSPTIFEDKLKLLPNKIVVTSKIAKKNRSEFFNKAKIILGPSLGKQKIFKKIKFLYKYKFVVALCGIKSIDEKLLLWTCYALKQDKNIKILIKPHPTMSINKLDNFNKLDLINKCGIIEDNIDILLKKTEVLISSGPTGVIFEALIYGCKLLYLVLDPSDLLMFKNLLSKNKNYILIKDEVELSKNIQFWKNKKLIKKNNNFKSLFFTKINNDNLKIFY
jgi:hypothetical protein